jgi:protein-disulfide isomerase
MNESRTLLAGRRITWHLVCIVLMGAIAGSARAAGSGSVPASLSALQPPPSTVTLDPTVVATVGRERILQSTVIADDRAAFDARQSAYEGELRGLRIAYERELHKLQIDFARARHKELKGQLDKMLDHLALEKEAKAEHASPDTVLKQISVAAVSDADVRAFYDTNKSRTKLSYEQLAPRIREYLAAQNNDAAVRAFYRKLRAKYDIVSRLEPFRLQVAPTGPVRGSPDAAVTVVEFADFQCPYCKEAESTLHALLAKFPNQVRVVFRNLPIPQLHPHALIAAKAGVCARRQGKFWVMHDAMYADQDALDPAGLKGMASRVGLDAKKFDACLSQASTMAVVNADLQAATRLGLTSTPYFFVDGRPLDGAVPLERFETLVDEELQRRSASGELSRAESVTASKAAQATNVAHL